MEEKKRKKEKKRKETNIVKVNVCLSLFYFLYIYFYDKIVKIKKEFNILIGSRSRIINLYVSCISNTQ